MAILSIFFSPPDDIHVMRGRSSRSLLGALGISPTSDVNGGNAFLATDNAKLLAAGGASVNVTFSITFPNNVHGVRLNTGRAPGDPAGPPVSGTGVVAADPLPLPANFPRNFIVTAQVLGTAVAPDPPPKFTAQIRVHVHNSVAAVVLSPPSLTARQELGGIPGSPVGFSVLARFDDQVLADITNHGDPAVPASRITWQTSTPALIGINASTGMFNAGASASPPFGSVSAALPAELNFAGPNPTGTVTFADGWSTQRTAKPVTGTKSRIPKVDGFNLLLLPDGFLATEQGKFEKYARNLLKKWKDTPAVAPFGVMPVNAFTVSVNSGQKGTTVRNPLFYNDRTAGKQKALALMAKAPPAGRSPPVKTLAELIYVVGFPTNAEAATLLATKQAEWTALYGAAAIANVDATLYGKWTAVQDYVIPAETDTAFGAVTGLAGTTAVDDGRRINWHPRRAQRVDVDKMLTALVDEAGAPIAPVRDATGAVVGNIWTAPSPAIGRVTIAILASGGRSAGTRQTASPVGGPGEMIFSSLNNDPTVLLADVPARQHPNLRFYPITPHMPLTSIARITHELGHGLTLGDEYGGAHRPAGSARTAVASHANLQAEEDVTDPTTGLTASLILWNSWPRISAAGLVIANVTGVNPNYDVTLRPGHSDFFIADDGSIAGDTVQLRKRPFYGPVGVAPNAHLQYLPESIEFTVHQITKGAAGDVVRIVRKGTGAFNAGDYTANNAILFVKQGTPMMHPVVAQTINTRQLPLNRLPGLIAPVCVDDNSVRQIIIHPVEGLKAGKPKLHAYLVGLCDGGAEFYCGIFHPRGACMMRALQVSYTKPEITTKKGFLYDFCPVCRYIMIDKVDPSLHGKMDDIYEEIYPEAK